MEFLLFQNKKNLGTCSLWKFGVKRLCVVPRFLLYIKYYTDAERIKNDVPISFDNVQNSLKKIQLRQPKKYYSNFEKLVSKFEKKIYLEYK